MRQRSGADATLVRNGLPEASHPGRGLLHWFLAKSLSFQFLTALALVLTIAIASLTLWLTNRATTRLLDSTAKTAAFYMQNLLQPHVQTLALQRDLSATELADLARLSEGFRRQGHFLAIKVWRPDGTLAFAPHDDGAPEHSPDEIADALRGQVVGRLSNLDDDEHDPERALGVNLYEIYAPLYEIGTGRILAVGEFYQNADIMSRALVASAKSTWAFVLPFGAAVFLLLFIIVRRGSRTIERQHQELRQQLADQARLHEINQALSHRMTDALQKAARIDDLRQQQLGADLHDGAGQLLAFLLLKIDRLAKLLRARDPDDLDSADEIVSDMRDSASQAMEEIRVISGGLVSPYLARARSLRDAVEAILREHLRRTGGKVTLHFETADLTPPDGPLRAIARILQEALSNAGKHAPGAPVEMSVEPDGDQLVMTVADRGPGPGTAHRAPSGSGTGGLGVPGMRFRAEALGGTLEVAARPGGGTSVICRIPLASLAEDGGA